VNSARRHALLAPRRPVLSARSLAGSVALLLGLFAPWDGSAQPGTFDATFQFGPTTPAATELLSVGWLPDGKVLISGDFTSVQGYYRNGFARLNPDGSLDLTFDQVLSFVPAEILTQADGKYLLKTGVQLFRYNQDGTADDSFSIVPAVHPSAEIRQILLAPDGRLLLVGHIWRQVGTIAEARGLQPLNANGSWGGNFSTTIQVVQSEYVQPNGQILVGGDFTVPWPDGRTRSRILRLNSNGTVSRRSSASRRC